MVRRISFFAFLAWVLLLAPSALRGDSPLWEEPGAFAVDFTYEPEKPVVGKPVTFIAIFKGTPSSGSIVTWYFGNRAAVVGNPVTYTFEAGGPQPVVVEVFQPAGKPLSESKVVEIQSAQSDDEPLPTPAGALAVSFAWKQEMPVAGEPVLFVAIFKGTPTDDAVLTWEFPRGQKMQGNPVEYTFPTSRKWLVTVTLEQGGHKPLQASAFVPVSPGKIPRSGR